ncbi:MAG: Ada metal-binding domain-containing protein [Selenomonadaceae bacterium]
MTRDEMVKICKARDKSYTGKFYLAVKSTKIVCNPGCPSRVPLEKNMVFYDTLEAAMADGYRPCKVCMKDMWGRK